MKRERRRTTPETAADLMGKVMQRLGGTVHLNEYQAFGAYSEAAGPVLARHSQPESLRGKTLFVAVDSSAVAHELTMLKGEILERMAAALGAGLIADIRTRVRSLR